MNRFEQTKSKKKLELKKTAIASLTLDNAKMKAIVGGGKEKPPITLQTSRLINDEGGATCTSDDLHQPKFF